MPGWRGLLASGACALPVLFGFVLPAAVLLHDALVHVAAGLAPEFWEAALNSLMLAAAAAALAVGFAVVLAYARRQTRSQLIQAASTLPAISYAIPGTVLAIGLLIPLAGFDNFVDGLMRSLFGVSTGLVLSGTAFAIVLAYTIRFLRRLARRGGGRVEQGLPQYRCRGADARRHHQRGAGQGASAATAGPRSAPRLSSYSSNSMKELPATLLLRPFNFDTLATQVFTLVSLYRYEEAGVSALTIVLVSLAPVLLLHGIIAGSRPGASTNQRGASATGPEWALPRVLICQQNAPDLGSLSRPNRARKTGSYGQSKNRRGPG